MPAKAKYLDIRPATGHLDARSAPDELETKAWRYLRNFRTTQKGKLCRITGWDKLLTRTAYNNADLHSQLENLTGATSRLPITLLAELTSTRKTTKLLAATSKAVYGLNNGTGNWRILYDKFTSATARVKAAQLLDTIVISNNHDEPLYWNFDAAALAADDQSFAVIPDLRTIGLTKAGVVLVWKDHLFLMNVVIEGSVKSYGIYWSNYQKPLDLIPQSGSTAGNQDLDYDETILGAAPIGNRLLIYTNKGIWEGQVGGSGPVFSFSKRYDPEKTGDACLFYPNTLVSVGNEHLYAGIDGIYLYNLFEEKPKRIEYMHKASSLMFDQINRADCETHVAFYDFERKELLFSYAKGAETQPSETLVFNTEYSFAYVLDHGFSAGCNYVLKEPVTILRDFLRDRCICSDAEMVEHWDAFVKEGQFCTPEEAVSCPTPPTSLWTQTGLTLEEGIETENYDIATPDANSLCGQIGDLTLNELCEAESRLDECNSGQRFVVASTTDFCLKEFARVYYRETCIGFEGCGTYRRDGYRSLARSGALTGGVYEDDKELTAFIVEAAAEAQTTPSKFRLRIGRHSQAVDPNSDGCGIVWDEQGHKEIECLGIVSAAQHITDNTVPSEGYEWTLYYTALYFYFELEIFNDAVVPADTGGACCISRYSLRMRRLERRRQ